MGSGRSIALLVAGAALTTAGCRQLLGFEDPAIAEPADAALAIDAAPDGPATDLDGDGIANDLDNCPATANPAQENEDADKIGDACDVCPAAEDNDQADGDADGVGDACDPRPEAPGDTLAYFNGFNDPSLAAWAVVGNWSVSNGEAVLTAEADQLATLTIPDPTSTSRSMVSAGIRIATIHPTGAQGQSTGVTTNFQTGGGITCSFGYNAGTTNGFLDLRVSGAGMVIDTASYPYFVGMNGTLHLVRVGTNYTCLAQAASSPEVVLSGSASGSVAAPRVGFRVRSSSVRFQWITVVQIP